MSDTEFKMGDGNVRLKSGGPRMTVAYVSSDGKGIKCSWMDGSKLCTETFAPEMLEHIPDGEDELPIVSEYDD